MLSMSISDTPMLDKTTVLLVILLTVASTPRSRPVEAEVLSVLAEYPSLPIRFFASMTIELAVMLTLSPIAASRLGSITISTKETPTVKPPAETPVIFELM